MSVIVCHSTCWACKFNHHYDPPTWHSWADYDEIEENEKLGEQPCACPCAGVRESSACEVIEAENE